MFALLRACLFNDAANVEKVNDFIRHRPFHVLTCWQLRHLRGRSGQTFTH